MDPAQSPVALDWTGSGLECAFHGTDLWAELEAPAFSPVMWMIVLADGAPVTRFPVEPGIRFYPLILGMEPQNTRTITLMKETQCMPDNPEATVLLHSLRMNGTLEELPVRDLRIEFVGDSLTSGEGALAPRGNDEWITPWFSARGNYSWVACNELNAERRILSQSGWGVCWDWEHNPEHTLTAHYEEIAGVLRGPAAEKRGCTKPYDFSAWRPDVVCIRLGTNDNNGMNVRNSLEEDRNRFVQGALGLLRRVRKNNPGAAVVWILPASDCRPELPAEAVRLAREEGMDRLYTFALPDYHEEDTGARFHPNAEWNRKAGLLLAAFLREQVLG
jgi:hypothetical protein